MVCFGDAPDERRRTHTVTKAQVMPNSSKDVILHNSMPHAKLKGLTNNESIISAVEVEDKILQAWFTNHTVEINDHMDDWR